MCGFFFFFPRCVFLRARRGTWTMRKGDGLDVIYFGQVIQKRMVGDYWVLAGIVGREGIPVRQLLHGVKYKNTYLHGSL